MPRVVVEHGELLDATHCSRCGLPLQVRTKSFFTQKPIGRCCMTAEALLRRQIDNATLDVEKFRNCGYLPDPNNGFKPPSKNLVDVG